MSSLSQKLAAFQAEVKKETTPEERQEIDQIPLETLRAMKISFGKAKFGLPFEEAFADQGWTKWFVNTFEASQKIECVKFLRYVALRAKEGKMPSTSATPKKTNPCLSHSATDGDQGGTPVSRDLIEHVCALSEATSPIGEAKFDYCMTSRNNTRKNIPEFVTSIYNSFEQSMPALQRRSNRELKDSFCSR